MGNAKRILLELDWKLAAELEKLANEQGTSQRAIIREAIAEHLSRNSTKAESPRAAMIHMRDELEALIRTCDVDGNLPASKQTGASPFHFV